MKKQKRDLSGLRVAVLAADGVEKVELVVPVKALKKAGAEVDIVSLRHGRIRSVNVHEPAERIGVDLTVHEASPVEYDALLVPGGLINPDLLRQSAQAREFVRAFDMVGKPIATICHGPWVLASAGLLDGRVMTSWPGIRDDVVNAGATWLDEEVVVDGNLVSSRGPQDLVPFCDAMLDVFAGLQPEEYAPQPTVSAPQAMEPPAAMLKAMKWTPRPSFRGAAIMAAVTAGLVALAWKLIPTETDGVYMDVEEKLEPMEFDGPRPPIRREFLVVEEVRTEERPGM